MSERKVLNKYYPPEFDPSKIPKLHLSKNRVFNIRIMAPFNMRCNTCGEYIYKGKKFNSRKENAEGEDYLGLRIFRFYIRCPRCVGEISFKTDPENTDYSLEAGATRNFEALRTAEKLAEKEMKDKEDEEANNPMKLLENRTKASCQEMEMLETLGELKELNSRHAKVDYEQMLVKHRAHEAQLRDLQAEEDEAFVQSLFGAKNGSGSVKRLGDDDEVEECSAPPASKIKLDRPTDILATQESSLKSSKPSSSAAMKPPAWQKGVGSASRKQALSGLVKRKQPAAKTPSSADDQEKPSNADGVRTSTSGGPEKTVSEPAPSVIASHNAPAEVASTRPTDPAPSSKASHNAPAAVTSPSVTVPTGLGLLGAYSDSEGDSSTSD